MSLYFLTVWYISLIHAQSQTGRMHLFTDAFIVTKLCYLLWKVLNRMDIASMKFGIKTSSSKLINNVTITLFMNTAQFQCKVEPIHNSTYHLCDIGHECVYNLYQTSIDIYNGIMRY